jgi:hypothetical protein
MLSFKSYLCFLSVMSLLILFSCQSEEAAQEYSMQETITNSSPLTSYMQRIAMVKTVEDNRIDKSSYCTVKFPYNVTVDGVSIEINATADYQKVWDKLNANNTDEEVKINFPVTMVYYNYNEKVVDNQSDFQQLLDYWNTFPDLLSKINCLNINYPITINIYNTANQIASSVKIVDDRTYFFFINNLKSNQLIAIKYPISITDSNNSVTTISTNLQFENAIKYAIDNCTENQNSSLNFLDVISSGSWKISYFYDNSEKTSSYNGYEFLFKNNQTVTVTKSDVNVDGVWESKIDDGVREFKIDLNTNLLHDLDKDWKLFEFNASQIRFRRALDHDDDNDETDYLYFTKID